MVVHQEPLPLREQRHCWADLRRSSPWKSRTRFAAVLAMAPAGGSTWALVSWLRLKVAWMAEPPTGTTSPVFLARGRCLTDRNTSLLPTRAA